MQIQTTTITTENLKVQNLPFTITTFEQKREVYCDICGSQDEGTDAELKRRGWTFDRGLAEFCPNCF